MNGVFFSATMATVATMNMIPGTTSPQRRSDGGIRSSCHRRHRRDRRAHPFAALVSEAKSADSASVGIGEKRDFSFSSLPGSMVFVRGRNHRPGRFSRNAGRCCRTRFDGKRPVGCARAAIPLGEPTILCSRMDESIIVGYYTFCRMCSPGATYGMYLEK